MHNSLRQPWGRLRAGPVSVLALTLAAGLALGLAPPAGAQGEESWRQSVADERNTRQGPAAGPDDPGLAWYTHFGEIETDDAPEGYTASHGHSRGPLYPVVAGDGTVVWQVDNEDPQYDRAGDAREVIGLDPDSGEVAWELGNVAVDTRAACHPVIDSQDRVWTPRPPDEDGQYRLQAAEAATGELIDGTEVALGEDFPCSRGVAPMVAGDGSDEWLVLPGVSRDPDTLVTIDISGGDAEVAWELSDQDPDFGALANASPEFDAGTVATGDSLITAVRTGGDDEIGGQLELVELSLADGSEQSRVSMPLPELEGDEDVDDAGEAYRRVHLLLTDDDTLVASPERASTDDDAPHYLAAFDLSDGLGDADWVERIGDFRGAPLALGDGEVITHTGSRGETTGFSLADGSEQWTAGGGDLDDRKEPTDARGFVYTRADNVDGVVDGHLLNYDAGELRWSIQEETARQVISDETGVPEDDVAVSLGNSVLVSAMGPDGTLYLTQSSSSGHNWMLAVDDSGGLGDVADADPDDEDRVAGGDRQETAIELCQSYDSADEVLLARSDDYADALAGAPLAAELGACILLTQSTQLDDRVATEIDRLGASSARLLGGTAALDDSVEQAVTADTGVESTQRYAGTNRFDTAAQVADDLADPDTAYVVRGRGDTADTGWEDAVAVSALAAYEGNPILLVTTDDMPQDTLQALDTQGFVDEAVIVGGNAVVSEGVEVQLNEVMMDQTRVSRIAGADRYATSAEVADASVDAGMDPANTWIATGRDFADALAGGPIIAGTAPAIADEGGVLLLVDGDDLSRSQASQQWLEAGAGSIDRIRTIGGTAAVSAAVTDEVRAAAGLE